MWFHPCKDMKSKTLPTRADADDKYEKQCTLDHDKMVQSVQCISASGSTGMLACEGNDMTNTGEGLGFNRWCEVMLW